MALVEHLRQQFPGAESHPLRLSSKLLSLDSSVIDLYVKTFLKGAEELYLLLDQDGPLPHYAVTTGVKRTDMKVAKPLHFPEVAMLIFDHDYRDYE